MPRWVLGLLVGGLVACVVAVAFLLGRVTAPAPAVAPPIQAATSAPASSGPASVPEVLGGPSTAAPDPGGEPGRDLASAATSPAEARVVGAAEAEAIAAYFRQMDALDAEAKANQDPQVLARSILDQAMSGNMGAIDGLIATQRSLEARLGQIAPPASCREHHQRSVRLFGRAIVLLERTREAMTGKGNPADLASVATEGRAIESEAKTLDALANDLRRAAGLAPVP